jgi:hypothetical protein
MSAIDNTPENKNFLSPLNFKFFIKRSPHVNFFIQKVNIPDITLKPATYPNPLVNIPIPGEHLDYGILNITFKVDEDLQNYLEIHNWIRALGKPTDYEEHKAISEKAIITGEGIYSDISLMILSSTKMANYEVIFTDAHPVNISGLTFNTTDSDVNYIEASASFKYVYYDINNI